MNKLRTRHNRDAWSAHNEKSRPMTSEQFDALNDGSSPSRQLLRVNDAVDKCAPGSVGQSFFPLVDRKTRTIGIWVPKPDGCTRDPGHSITFDEFLADETGSISRLIKAIKS